MEINGISEGPGRAARRQALETLQLDHPDAQLAFTVRLARENGWRDSYAERVVSEYRRFLILTQEAGHSVTPSDAVDQAWHLHLAYTEHYWKTLCGEILKRPLHHGPTRGGKSENIRFFDQYARTLDAYQRIFGEEAPADIWPEPEQRFTGRFERVDRASHWVVPKPPLAIPGPMTSGALALFVGLFGFSGWAFAEEAGLFGFDLREFFWPILFFVVVGVVVFSLSDRRNRDRGGCGSGGCGSGCGGGCC
ncbi:MAG: hypothetical protein AAGF59_10500 [Pseudomonadota bacterium]